MTLILSVVTRDYIVQTSDRLISLTYDARPDVMLEGDPRANKCVIYRAKDGILAIGFAGYAYHGDMPMDEWIVETLIGEPLERHDEMPGFGNRFGGSTRLLTVAQAAWHLEQAIRRDIPRRRHFELVVAGFVADRDTAIPYFVDMLKPAKGELRVTGRSPRFPDPRRRVALLFNGASITDAEMKALHARLMALGKRVAAQDRNPSIPEVADEMVAFTRDLADRYRGIGKNILAVGLTRFGLGYSKFHGAEKHPLWLKGSSAPIIEIGDTGQKPWIVGPGLLSAPSYEVGIGDFNIGGYNIRTIGAEPTGRMQGLSSSIRRPTIRQMVGHPKKR